MNPAAMLRLASAITDVPTPVLVAKLNEEWLACGSEPVHTNQTRQSGST